MNPTYRAYFRNVHLFGQTAEFTLGLGQPYHELGFYLRDRERVPQIISEISESNADFVGLCEVWDAKMGEELRRSLSEQYPYSRLYTGGPGLGGLITTGFERRPWLNRLLSAETIKRVTNTFTQGHYGADQETAGAKGLIAGLGLFSEDRIGRTLSSVTSALGSTHLWEGGILFLSKHPIDSWNFIRHPQKADWEHMADKGVLWVTVIVKDEHGNEQEVHVAVGHYQEGGESSEEVETRESPEAVEAREAQIARTSHEINARGGRVLIMGDFNIISQTREHRHMMGALKLFQATSGATYRDPNPFQAKLTGRPMSSFKEREMEIDYILFGDGLYPVPHMLRRPKVYTDSSDHREIIADFTISRQRSNHRPVVHR